MTRIYLPSTGPEDWRRLLGDPLKHWRTSYSARTLAHCWEAANGLPPEIAAMLESIGENPELLLAIPEHKVPLPGAARGESQNDLFALVRAGDKLVAVTIEGKVNEPFDQPMMKWLANASPGKRDRLSYLCEMLGLCEPLPADLHYQLLHRAVSALIEAKCFNAQLAVMIVHSFSPEKLWFDAFARFTGLFGVEVQTGILRPLRPDADIPLYAGWACGDASFLTR
ncbi:MAG: hypothetical protein JO256_06520 [Alphaproteobacteria bacterium]|nr:hypothetical protein [Alphaproteobacteria bacterium]